MSHLKLQKDLKLLNRCMNTDNSAVFSTPVTVDTQYRYVDASGRIHKEMPIDGGDVAIESRKLVAYRGETKWQPWERS